MAIEMPNVSSSGMGEVPSFCDRGEVDMAAQVQEIVSARSVNEEMGVSADGAGMEMALIMGSVDALESSAQLTPTELPTFDTFECFPGLPPELQNMFWKELLPGPREVKILPSKKLRSKPCISKCNGDENEYRRDQFEYHRAQDALELTSTCTTPIGLLINSESRSFTLGFFEEVFKNSKCSGDKPIYINPASDTVFFSADFFMHKLRNLTDPRDMGFFQEFNIYYSSFWGTENCRRNKLVTFLERRFTFSRKLCYFHNLRTVNLVVNEECTHFYAPVSQLESTFQATARSYGGTNVDRINFIYMKEKEADLDPDVLKAQFE